MYFGTSRTGRMPVRLLCRVLGIDYRTTDVGVGCEGAGWGETFALTSAMAASSSRLHSSRQVISAAGGAKPPFLCVTSSRLLLTQASIS